MGNYGESMKINDNQWKTNEKSMKINWNLKINGNQLKRMKTNENK